MCVMLRSEGVCVVTLETIQSSPGRSLGCEFGSHELGRYSVLRRTHFSATCKGRCVSIWTVRFRVNGSLSTLTFVE